MLQRTLCIVSLLLTAVMTPAQSDSVLCDANCKIKEGIFITYNDFRKNDPVTKENIESSIDREHLDFFGKSLMQEKLAYTRNGTKIYVDPKNVWGFFQNQNLHVNYNGEFFRVPLFGSISFLVGTVEVLSPTYYGVGYGGVMGSSGIKTRELRNFLINFYDGVVTEFSMEFAKRLLSRDEALYKEFCSLRPRKQKEQVSRYIRKYNELHPVYFLK
jgi:hypothetical protein